MSSNLPKKDVLLIVRTHVESNTGSKLRVFRLEPSKEGRRLLTSSSTSITDDECLTPQVKARRTNWSIRPRDLA